MRDGFVSCGPVIGENEIAAFETRCGFRLPSDYRAFLLDQNGGHRPPKMPPASDAGMDWSQVLFPHHQFFSLGVAAAAGVSIDEMLALANDAASSEEWQVLMELPEWSSDLEVHMHLCRGDGRPGFYPPELLPIAVGDPHDLLLLRLDGPNAGAVDLSFDPDGYCEWHLDRVANSFTDLLRDFKVW